MIETDPLRLTLIGWGAISRRVAQLLVQHDLPVRLVSVGLRLSSERPLDMPKDVQLLRAPGELGAGTTELVVEAASAAALCEWGPAAFAAEAHFAPVSISALTDDRLHAKLITAAEVSKRQLLLPTGAIGGIDILRAAALTGLDRVEHIVAKPPTAWLGTKAESLIDLAALKTRAEFFSASAREAAAAFPQNANATVTTALAGLGLDRTQVTLVADPGLTQNLHLLRFAGEAGDYEIRLSNNPMPSNAKTSDMTALSLVRLIEAEASRLLRRGSS